MRTVVCPHKGNLLDVVLYYCRDPNQNLDKDISKTGPAVIDIVTLPFHIVDIRFIVTGYVDRWLWLKFCTVKDFSAPELFSLVATEF